MAKYGFGLQILFQAEDAEKNGLGPVLQGALPLAGGLYPGKVIKVSGDPDKRERIQVHIPLLHEEGSGVWARAATLYAGNGRAVVFRPEKDDEVVLGFLGGDPRAPVILGAMPSKAAPPPDKLKAADEKNTLKVLVSKSGLTLLLNEEDKSFTLQTPAGQLLCINDKDAAVTLKDKNGNSLVMDKAGIKLKSDKDIMVEASGNISLKATRNFKVEGLQATVEGKQSLALSGVATAELKASGPLTIKGAIVRIN